MQPAEGAQIERKARSDSHERPWLFSFLIAPDAVISIGLVTGALTYLLRNEGVDPGRAASIAALIAIPHAIYFFWGPITDFWVRRRTWLASPPPLPRSRFWRPSISPASHPRGPSASCS